MLRCFVYDNPGGWSRKVEDKAVKTVGVTDWWMSTPILGIVGAGEREPLRRVDQGGVPTGKALACLTPSWPR
jgi:hypothetical protein